VLKCHTSIRGSFLFCLTECVSIFVVTVRDPNTCFPQSSSVRVLSADSSYLTLRSQIFESPAINAAVVRFHEKHLPCLFQTVLLFSAERVSHSCIGHAWCSTVLSIPIRYKPLHCQLKPATIVEDVTFLCRLLLGRNQDRMGFQSVLRVWHDCCA